MRSAINHRSACDRGRSRINARKSRKASCSSLAKPIRSHAGSSFADVTGSVKTPIFPDANSRTLSPSIQTSGPSCLPNICANLFVLRTVGAVIGEGSFRGRDPDTIRSTLSISQEPVCRDRKVMVDGGHRCCRRLTGSGIAETIGPRKRVRAEPGAERPGAATLARRAKPPTGHGVGTENGVRGSPASGENGGRNSSGVSRPLAGRVDVAPDLGKCCVISIAYGGRAYYH